LRPSQPPRIPRKAGRRRKQRSRPAPNASPTLEDRRTARIPARYSRGWCRDPPRCGTEGPGVLFRVSQFRGPSKRSSRQPHRWRDSCFRSAPEPPPARYPTDSRGRGNDPSPGFMTGAPCKSSTSASRRYSPSQGSQVTPATTAGARALREACCGETV
jgi:hypothetical protein